MLEGTGQLEPHTSTKDEVPTSKEAESAANEAILEDKSHVHVVGQGHTPVESEYPERDAVLKEGALEEKLGAGKEDAGSNLKNEVSATDAGENMGGKRTQEQKAAKGEEVGQSVGD